MRKVSIYSGKGGVGKSTIAVNLAGWYASRGKRVCVVDTDKQQTLSDIYLQNLCGFDVQITEPRPSDGYDYVLFDHHPSHDMIQLCDHVVCPIRPSRIDFESYRRSRAFIGNRQHILVVNQYRDQADDNAFIVSLKKLCVGENIPLNKIKNRNIFKKMTNNAKTVFNIEGRAYGKSEAQNDIRLLAGKVDEWFK